MPRPLRMDLSSSQCSVLLWVTASSLWRVPRLLASRRNGSNAPGRIGSTYRSCCRPWRWGRRVQEQGDPGVAERVPGQGFAGCDIDLPAVVAVVVGPGGKTGLHQHLLQSIAPDPGAQGCSGLLIGEQQIAFASWGA